MTGSRGEALSGLRRVRSNLAGKTLDWADRHLSSILSLSNRGILDTVWMWSGYGLDTVWMWSGCGLDVAWIRSGCGLGCLSGMPSSDKKSLFIVA